MTAGRSDAFSKLEQYVQSLTDVLQYLPLFYSGIGMTVLLWLASLAVATVLGLLLALASWSSIPVLSQAASTYVLFIRGVPILVQIFYIYFLLPSIGVTLPAYWAAVAGLGFAFSAYMAEVFRAGILAVDTGQVEAATSLAMPPLVIARRVIVPQAVRTALPGYSNIVVMMLKTTSLASVIAVPEMSRTAFLLVQATYKSIELFTLLALLYIAISIPLIILIRRMERR